MIADERLSFPHEGAGLKANLVGQGAGFAQISRFLVSLRSWRFSLLIILVVLFWVSRPAVSSEWGPGNITPQDSLQSIAGDEPALDADRQTISRLIDELGSAQYSKRQQAIDALKRIGKPALQPLAFELLTANPELHWRIRQILEEIAFTSDAETMIRGTAVLQVRFPNVQLASLRKKWKSRKRTEAIRKLRELGVEVEDLRDRRMFGFRGLGPGFQIQPRLLRPMPEVRIEGIQGNWIPAPMEADFEDVILPPVLLEDAEPEEIVGLPPAEPLEIPIDVPAVQRIPEPDLDHQDDGRPVAQAPQQDDQEPVESKAGGKYQLQLNELQANQGERNRTEPNQGKPGANDRDDTNPQLPEPAPTRLTEEALDQVVQLPLAEQLDWVFDSPYIWVQQLVDRGDTQALPKPVTPTNRWAQDFRPINANSKPVALTFSRRWKGTVRDLRLLPVLDLVAVSFEDMEIDPDVLRQVVAALPESLTIERCRLKARPNQRSRIPMGVQAAASGSDMGIENQDKLGEARKATVAAKRNRIHALVLREIDQTEAFLKHFRENESIGFTEIGLPKSSVDNRCLELLSQFPDLNVLQLDDFKMDQLSFAWLSKMRGLRAVVLQRCRFQIDDFQMFQRERKSVDVAFLATAFLGVSGAPLRNDQISITQVVVGSSADQAGVKVGDTLLRFDGRPVANFEDLRLLISQCAIGDTVEMEVERDGEKLTLKAKLRANEQVIR